MKRVKGSTILILLIAISSFLVACGGSNNAPARPLYSGSDGIIVSFPQSNALRQFQGDWFTVSVRLLNDGTADLTRESPGIITAAYDSSVIQAREVRTSSTQFTSSSSVSSTSPTSGGQAGAGATQDLLSRAFDIVNQLTGGDGSTGAGGSAGGARSGYARAPFTARGRSFDMPVGDIAFVEVTFESQKLSQNRQTATTPLTIQACYPYTTTFIGNVCVDRDLLNGGSGGGCNAATITAQPQGAPVAVRSITPRYTRVDGGVQARYEITIENIRDGLVLWPGEDVDSVAACDLSKLATQDYGRAEVTAQVTGTKLRCGADNELAGIARFDRRSAAIVCRLDNSDLPPGFESGANFEAPLIVQVRYFYIQTTTAQLEVVQQ